MNTLKKLMKSIRQYKLHSILSPVCVTVEVALECIIPLYMIEMLKKIEEDISIRNILFYGGILLVLSAFSLVFGILAGKFAATASTGFAKNLRQDMYYRIQGFAFSNIDKFSAPSLVTRMTTDVANVQMAYMMIVRIAVRSPIMLIFSLIMAFVINVKIAFVFVAVIPVLGIGLFVMFRLVDPIFTRVFKKYDAMNESIQENIKGIRVVKSYVRDEYENDKFKKTSNDVRYDFLKGEKIIALANPLLQFCMWFSILMICFLVPMFGVKEGVGRSSEMSSLIVYASQILSSLMMLSMVMIMISMSNTSSKRIVEVLSEESDLHAPAQPIYEVADGSVRFEDVDFKYDVKAERRALKGVNLDIKSGETIGILGGTGSSKTSLVNLIPRLYDATSGHVYVGGHNVKQYDLDTLRNEVAVVLQKNVLFSGTIKQNLRWGDPNASDEELERVCKLAQAHEFIMGFPDKYDTYIEQGGSNVSGGQKQRLAIARALSKKAPIYVFDDSFSALDFKTDAKLRQALAEEMGDACVIIVAQRVGTIKNADNIVVLDDGKIAGIGKHEYLLKNCKTYLDIAKSQLSEEELGL